MQLCKAVNSQWLKLIKKVTVIHKTLLGLSLCACVHLENLDDLT